MLIRCSISLRSGNDISKGESASADICDLSQFGKFGPDDSKCPLLDRESLVLSSLSELFMIHFVILLATA